MNACMFLIFKQWRNSLREKIRHPQFWIGALIVVAYFALYIYQEINHIGRSGILDNAEATYKGAVVFVFLILMFVGLGIGLNQGNAFFSSADIDHLFVSPIRAEKVLLYGLIKKCLFSVLATLVLLMQLTNLRFYFGLGFQDLLILHFVEDAHALFEISLFQDPLDFVLRHISPSASTPMPDASI